VSNFVPDPGRAVEQERRTSGQHGAGRVSRGQWSAYALLCAGTVHPLNETDGSLNLASLGFTASVKRALANDVTVCGEHEPVAYVTEYFLGDGVTTQFYLAADPFFPAASKSTIISELFNESAINQACGAITGGGLSFAGRKRLVMNGGNGIDGETLLSWLDPVEMGGTLLLEAVGVTLVAGQHGDSGRLLLLARIRRLRALRVSGDGAAGHRGSHIAAADSRNAVGNGLCDESSQPIHAARQSALRGE
jgi:hypothetical protein